MDELKKEETPELDQETGQEEKKGRFNLTSYMIQCLAGVYLIYLGYSLCKNVIIGAEGASIGFIVPGILFLVGGAVIGCIGLRGVLKSEKDNKIKEAAERAKATAEYAVGKDLPKTPAKKTSIADRANLVQPVEEDEEDSTKES